MPVVLDNPYTELWSLIKPTNNVSGYEYLKTDQ